jgi:hypothetical protein
MLAEYGKGRATGRHANTQHHYSLATVLARVFLNSRYEPHHGPIEALFSQYDGLKDKGNMRRSILSDDHALDALLAREAKHIVEDVMCPFSDAARLHQN